MEKKIHIQIGEHLFSSSVFHFDYSKRDREDCDPRLSNPFPEIHNKVFIIDLDSNAMMAARMKLGCEVVVHMDGECFENVILGQIGYNGIHGECFDKYSTIEVRCSQSEYRYLDSKLNHFSNEYIYFGAGVIYA